MKKFTATICSLMIAAALTGCRESSRAAPSRILTSPACRANFFIYLVLFFCSFG